MDFTTRIKTLENELVHGKGITVYELADKLNKSHNYLCRISSIFEELPFPLELAVPAMKLKKNYDLLKFIAQECGFAVVRFPRVTANKKDEVDMVSGYQKLGSEAIDAVLDFFANPSGDNYIAVCDLLREVASESISIQKYVEKKYDRQLSLEL